MAYLTETSVRKNEEARAQAIAERSCLACYNYRARHPRTLISYCKDGSKEVFSDSGCEEWKVWTGFPPLSSD